MSLKSKIARTGALGVIGLVGLVSNGCATGAGTSLLGTGLNVLSGGAVNPRFGQTLAIAGSGLQVAGQAQATENSGARINIYNNSGTYPANWDCIHYIGKNGGEGYMYGIIRKRTKNYVLIQKTDGTGWKMSTDYVIDIKDYPN